jgi:fumarylacetoacetate (FAA) hydrolase family protein
MYLNAVGVGFGLKPPAYLRPGDRVDIAIEHLGTLSNTVGPSDMKLSKPFTGKPRSVINGVY